MKPYLNFSLDDSDLPPFLAIPWVLGLIVILQLVVILILAFAVKNDAGRRGHQPGGLFLVGPWTWFFVVLFTGGYLPALAYWLIHYSSLRFRREETT